MPAIDEVHRVPPMTAARVLQMQIDRMTQEYRQTVGDLNADQLAQRPARGANSIGFSVWHAVRAWDMYLTFLDGAEDTYVTHHWMDRFGFDTEGRGVNAAGSEFTEEDVGLVKPQPQTLIEYVDAVFARTKNYLAAASEETLAQDVRVPWWPEEKPKAFIVAHILRHSYQHLGEAQYAKGIIQAKS